MTKPYLKYSNQLNFNIMNLRILKTRDVKTPSRGTSGSAGLDFYVPNDWKQQSIAPGSGLNIPSGIRVLIPENHALIAFNKSGIAVKNQLTVGACVVDEDYTGEIHLNVINVGNEVQEIIPGMKLVQFLLMPVNMANVDVIDPEYAYLFDKDSERGDGGFGSTGLD